MAQWAVSTSGREATRQQQMQAKRPPWGGGGAPSASNGAHTNTNTVGGTRRSNGGSASSKAGKQQPAGSLIHGTSERPVGARPPTYTRSSRQNPILEAIADVQSGGGSTFSAPPPPSQQQRRTQRQSMASMQPRTKTNLASDTADPTSVWHALSGIGTLSSSATANNLGVVCTLDNAADSVGPAFVAFRDGSSDTHRGAQQTVSGFNTIKSGKYKIELDLRSGHAPQGSGRHAAFAVGLCMFDTNSNSAANSENETIFEMMCVRGDCVRREWTLSVVKSDTDIHTVRTDADIIARVPDANLRPNVWRRVAIEVRDSMLSMVSDGSVIFEHLQTGTDALCGPLVMATSRSRQMWRNLHIEAAPEGETELSYLRSSICKQSFDEDPSSSANRLLAGEDPALIECIERDILMKSPNVSFADIASLDDAKRILDEAVRLPLIIPEFFTGIREPWQGVLLFGPPGTGKTLLAKAVAAMGGVTFFNCGCSTLTSKYRGESEKLVRCLFRLARVHAPSIIFFDEVDALVSSRGADGEHEASRRFKSELLSQMDGIAATPGSVSATRDDMTEEEDSESMGGTVMVLATTNSPWDLDDAMRRRLEKRIYVPLPDAEAREQMFAIHLRGVTLAKDVELSSLAAQTDGFSGADIKCACRDASLMPMRRLVKDKTTREIKEMKERGELDRAQITLADFVSALSKTSPSVAASDIAKYEKWEADFANT